MQFSHKDLYYFESKPIRLDCFSVDNIFYLINFDNFE